MAIMIPQECDLSRRPMSEQIVFGELQKYLPDILYLNGKELVEHLYEEAWIEGTESEKKHF